MRCDNCQNEPLKPARYCDCCGHALEAHADETKQLPLPTENAVATNTTKSPVGVQSVRAVREERLTAVEPAASPVTVAASNDAAGSAEVPAPAEDPNDWAPNPATGPRQLRCPSCDGPSLDGNPCPTCYEFASAEPVSHPIEEACDDAAIESTVKSDAAAARPPSVRDTMTAEEKLASARATAAEMFRRAQEKAQRPATVVPRASIAVAPKKRRYHPIELVAAGLVVAALGVGAAWDRIHITRAAVRHEPPRTTVASPAVPTQAAETVTRPAPPVERPVAQTPVKAEPVAAVAKTPVVANVTPDRPSTPVKVAQNPSPALKPVAKTPTSTQPKAAPPPRPARKPAPAVVSKPVPAPAPAPVEKSAPTVLASAPVVAAPAVVVAEPAPKPAAPAAAVGPFFEPSQVNETPRLSGRAALKLPAALNNRTGSEVVIVRALVSQTGQPSRVSLLRRSKGGPELDDVVLAAVNQWTFSPAKKKGEAVSCWFNFAVTLGSDE